jgi:hypothetical protein
MAKVHPEKNNLLSPNTRSQSIIENRRHRPKRKPLTQNIQVNGRILDEVYRDMTGQWKDPDNSTHGSVSAPSTTKGALEFEQLRQKFSQQDSVCPVCGRKLFSGDLRTHLRQSCQARILSKHRKSRNIGGRKNKTDHGKAHTEVQGHEQDGSKGLGFMRRESNGQFGSYPMHDDYSEESNAD